MISLPRHADVDAKRAHYQAILASIDALLEGETDVTAAMATVACELASGFEAFDWTGFYRNHGSTLVVGPYQGSHGCLRIDFARGVCGAAARTRTTQRIDDVHTFADHIACSSSTESEIVVPILSDDGRLLAVLDVDSNTRAAFDEVDQQMLERLCQRLGSRFSNVRW